MKKYILIVLLIIFLCSIPFIGIYISILAENKRTYNFTFSPRHDYMSKEAIIVAERYCGGVGSWQQLGFNNDYEHVSIICKNQTMSVEEFINLTKILLQDLAAALRVKNEQR